MEDAPRIRFRPLDPTFRTRLRMHAGPFTWIRPRSNFPYYGMEMSLAGGWVVFSNSKNSNKPSHSLPKRIHFVPFHPPTTTTTTTKIASLQNRSLNFGKYCKFEKSCVEQSYNNCTTVLQQTVATELLDTTCAQARGQP